MHDFSSVPLDKASIAKLIPHAGNMVLLDSADAINASGLQCRSSSHLDKNNPLRTAEGLSASTGIEYAAQAMALHISLLNAAGPQTGFLAIGKNIVIKQRYLDAFDTELMITIKYLDGSVEMGMLQYAFTILADNGSNKENIISGELSIVVQT